MGSRNFFLLWLVALVITLLLSVSFTRAAQPSASGEVAVWELKQSKVADPGKTVAIPANKKTGFPGGVLTTGFAIEATARSKSDSMMPEGTFRLTLTAFSPAADMPAQKAGVWYIQGTWTLVDSRADGNALKARYSPHTLEGPVQSALPFNPALEKGKSMSLRAGVPMSPGAGPWARGKQGVLTLSAGLEGEIQLPLSRWAKTR